MREYRAHAQEIAEPHPNRSPACTSHSLTWEHAIDAYGMAEMLDFANTDHATSTQTIDKEFIAYITTPPSPCGTDIIKFWEVCTDPTWYYPSWWRDVQMNKTRLPTFFAIALDYLPIQASAVPCEHIFSSSAETDTKRQNQIHPILMEALQMLKFSLKQERLDFTEGLITPEADMLEHPEDDLLHELLMERLPNGLDDVLAAFGSEEIDNKNE